MRKQLEMFCTYRHAQKRIRAPFEVDACEATAPGRRQFFWRLLSRRQPYQPWMPSGLHFEMVIRDERQFTDIHLVRDAQDRLVEFEEETNGAKR